ncbi:hypothetical protein [Deinococcus misasensis]|uniref:hypothetical protein n=1 Tax=Deinococcus misasensis TaxID=392413 RepID=UPI00068BFA5A|nr:hypothetical protein [Deinococcus misasensis]
MEGPSGEDLYTHLLQASLKPDSKVLEAGCAHGPDAVEHVNQVALWTGYDWMEDFLKVSREKVPSGRFVCWDGKTQVPEVLQGSYNLLVSRRGPTSFLNHLQTFAAPEALVLCIYPTSEVRQKVLDRLQEAGADLLGEWTFRVRGHLPEFQDFVLHQRWNADERTMQALKEEWSLQATKHGFPFFEERYIVQARMP